MANKLGALSKLDAVPPVMARGEPATFYGDGNMPCARLYRECLCSTNVR